MLAIPSIHMSSAARIIALAYPTIKVQGANINENTGFKVKKCEPAGLEQRFRPFNAGKWDIASFIFQHLPNNFGIALLVH